MNLNSPTVSRSLKTDRSFIGKKCVCVSFFLAASDGMFQIARKSDSGHVTMHTTVNIQV